MAGVVLFSIFLGLSALHGYWVVKGTDDLTGFVPEVDGEPVLRPGRFATVAVATLLLLAALLCASEAELFGWPRWPLARIGVWTILVASFGRAVGDFRFVGFFKRVRGTRFARRDTWIYSPLCLVISILCASLLLSNRAG